MELNQVAALCRLFNGAGLEFWLDGGWRVDALLKVQTRSHSDLDLAVRLADLPVFQRLLAGEGFTRVDRPKDLDWNWVLFKDPDQSVDLHGFVFDAHGNGILGNPTKGSMYPAGALNGIGRLGEVEVRCVSAPYVLQFRNNFEPRTVDRLDVAALCSRFDLLPPSRFRRNSS